MCVGGFIIGLACCEDGTLVDADKSVPVPLVGVQTRVLIVDYTAEVTIKQRYENVEAFPIEAVYHFPLQDKAVVTSFEAEIDGRVVVGKIQEREQAKNTYDDAIAAGQGAYLLEESKESPNVFQASIGNLPPQKDVIITIRYVSELQVTADKCIQFVLATTRNFPDAQTFQTFPIPKFHQENPSVDHGLNVEIFLEMSSPIKSATSASHKILINQQSETLSKVVLLNDGLPLATNFELDVTLLSPHLASVKVQNVNQDEKVAMISLFPDQQSIDSVIYTEMIFLIDRSGSMSGSKINNVRSTMELFLRSIPEGTLFNIVGFGSNREFLFKNSVEYNDSTLSTATQSVAKMQANLGGTDILNPLKNILRDPPKEGIPRQIFVLTDGQVDNREACIEFVKKHALTTRVFTFGIGNDVDVDLVKGMAKAGEGAAELLRDQEIKDIDVKVLSQLKRALKPALTDLKIEWSKELDVTIYTPFTLPPLWGGSRLLIYAFLGKNSKPGEVVVKAKTARGDFEAKTFVDTNKLTEGSSIIKLAAKSLINDLEENKSIFDEVGFPLGKNARDEIIALSLTHQILSKQTAFVAVEKRSTPTTGTLKIREVDYETLQNEKKAKERSLSYQNTSLDNYDNQNRVQFFEQNDRDLDALSSTITTLGNIADQLEHEVDYQSETLSEENRTFRKSARSSKSSGFSLPSFSLPEISMPSFIKNIFSKKEPKKTELKNEEVGKASFGVSNYVYYGRQSEGNRFITNDDLDGITTNSDTFEEKKEEVKKEKGKEKEKEKESGVSQSLRAIILQQKSAGNFPVDVLKVLPFNTPQSVDTIEKLLPSDVAKIQGVLEIFITAIVVQYFVLRCKDSEVYWELVATKSKTWIAKESKRLSVDDKLDVLALAADFVQNNM